MKPLLPPSVLAELKRLSAEARSIHNCFNEATAQREFRILLAENADALISAAEERDELQSSLNAIAEALFPDAGQVIRSAEMDFEAGGAVSAIRSRARQLDSAKDDVKLLSARLLSVSAQLAEELMEKERKRLEIAGLKAELLDLKLRVEQTQAHLDEEVRSV